MELTLEEIIRLFNERKLNTKCNNYIVTDLDVGTRQKIIEALEKEIIVKTLDNNSFDEKYVIMNNIVVNLRDIPVRDLLSYLLYSLDIPKSIVFEDKFALLKYRGLLRNYGKCSAIILYNGEELGNKDRALLNDIYNFNTSFFNVNDLVLNDFLSYCQTTSGIFLDSRDDYTRIRLLK